MQYMARVEIHNATREMYERLHAAMEAESFNRTLTDEVTHKQSKMPIGAYWAESSNDRWAVMEAAKRAALPIDATAEIVVSGDGRIIFFNCPDAGADYSLPASMGLYGSLSRTRSTLGGLTGAIPAAPSLGPSPQFGGSFGR